MSLLFTVASVESASKVGLGIGAVLSGVVGLPASISRQPDQVWQVAGRTGAHSGVADKWLCALHRRTHRRRPQSRRSRACRLVAAQTVTRVADTRDPDDMLKRVKPHFTPTEVVDLRLRVNTINARNRFAIVFRTLPA